MATIGNIVPITVVAKLIGFRDTNPMQLLQAAFESTTMVGGTMPLDRLNDLVTRIGVIQEWIADQVTAAGEGDVLPITVTSPFKRRAFRPLQRQ